MEKRIDKKIDKKILTIITIIGSFASIVALIFIFFPKNKELNLDIYCYSKEELTSYTNSTEPEIKAKFYYKDLAIENLWKIDIEFRNSSSKTLVGSGKQSNLLVDTLEIYLQKGLDIIEKKELYADFRHSLTIEDYNTIKLSFMQWRPEEILKYSFYIRTSDKAELDGNIFEFPDFRQIIDGDINYFDKEKKNNEIRLTKFIPPSILIGLQVISIIIIGLINILFVFILFSNILGYFKRIFWRSKYLFQYNEYIIKKYSEIKIDFERYYNKPSKFIEFSKIKVPKYPEIGADFGIDKVYELLLTIIILTILIIALSVDILEIINIAFL